MSTSEPRGSQPAHARTRDRRPQGRWRRVVTIAWGAVVWVALWGDVTLANVVWGLVFALATLWLVPVAPRRYDLRVRFVPALRFAGWVAWALVRASLVVAWEVVTPRNDINEGIVAVPLGTDSRGVMTIIGNAISLTPGTLTLEARADPPTLYVHVLHLRAIEDVRADVVELERLACAAVGLDFAPRAPEASEPVDDSARRGDPE